MKNYILLGLVSSILIAPSLFADTATGTTATGTTATGTTATGTTATGTTATGTTATGTDCSTASGVKANMATAQQVFLTEMTRLITEKGVAYTAALSLSGSLKTDAIKAANVKFRAGVKAAIQTRETAKLTNRLDVFTRKIECKKEKKDEKKERQESKHEEKNEMKHQVKELQKAIKIIKKSYKANNKNN